MKTDGDVIAKYGGSWEGDGQLGAEGSEFYIGAKDCHWMEMIIFMFLIL